jgi:hypothetical protein
MQGGQREADPLRVDLGLSLQQAIALDEPQDAIFRITVSTIARIST